MGAMADGHCSCGADNISCNRPRQEEKNRLRRVLYPDVFLTSEEIHGRNQSHRCHFC